MHFSTIPNEWQEEPENHCIPNLKVEVRIVRVDCGEERIGLSFIHAEYPENDEVVAKYAESLEKKKARKAAKEKAKLEAAAAEASAVEDLDDEEGEALQNVEPAVVLEAVVPAGEDSSVSSAGDEAVDLPREVDETQSGDLQADSEEE